MYATATISNEAELLSDLVTFISANGWNIVTDQTEGTGRRVTFNKIPGQYVHLRSVHNEGGVVNYVGNYYGVITTVSRTNNPASIGANSDQCAVLNGMISMNPNLPTTYHFFSTPDGNSINVAIIGRLIDPTSVEYASFFGFGTSIHKTTTIDQAWYFYTQGAANNYLLYRDQNYTWASISNETYTNSFLLNAGSVSANSSILGVFTNDPYYTANNQYNGLYFTQEPQGSYGIMALKDADTYGFGNYNTMFMNSASTAFANTVLIPSYVFMRNASIGFNLVGSIPGLWLSNSVPALYHNGQTVEINGKNHVVFRPHVYEIDP